MPWIQQTNPDTMQPQWVFRKVAPDGVVSFTASSDKQPADMNADPNAPLFSSVRPQPDAQHSAYAIDANGMPIGYVSRAEAEKVLGTKNDVSANGQGSGWQGGTGGYWSDNAGMIEKATTPFKGGFMDDLGANLVLPGLAALVGGGMLTGFGGVGGASPLDFSALDVNPTGALSTNPAQYASGYGGVTDVAGTPAFPSGPYGAVTDASSFGQPAFNAGEFTTGAAPNLTADALGYGANTGGIIPAGATVNLANSAGLIPAAGIGATIPAGLGAAFTSGAGGAGAAGTTAGTAAAAAPAGASAISKILSGTATADDWAALAGKVAPGLISAFGSSQAADNAAKLAEDFKAFGAPSRGRFEASMTPGFDPSTIPGYKGALDSTAEAISRRMSVGGNPSANPGNYIEANKAIINGTALPAVQNYQNTNAAAGGLGAISASYPGAATSASTANNNVYSDLGSAFRAATAEPSTIDEILKRLATKSASATGLV